MNDPISRTVTGGRLTGGGPCVDGNLLTPSQECPPFLLTRCPLISHRVIPPQSFLKIF